MKVEAFISDFFFFFFLFFGMMWNPPKWFSNHNYPRPLAWQLLPTNITAPAHPCHCPCPPASLPLPICITVLPICIIVLPTCIQLHICRLSGLFICIIDQSAGCRPHFSEYCAKRQIKKHSSFMLVMHIHSLKYFITHSFFQSWRHVLVVLCLNLSSFPPSFSRLTMVLLHKSVSLYCTKRIMIRLNEESRVTNWVKNSWLDRGSMLTALKRLKWFHFVKIKEIRKGWGHRPLQAAAPLIISFPDTHTDTT